MNTFIYQLLRSPLFSPLYYACWLVLLTILSAGFYKYQSSLLWGNKSFYWICILLLVVSRLPSILLNEQLNIDESLMIAQALTLLQNPIYWDSVDGTTIGPINSYLLTWPGLFNLPITFLTTRLTGTFLIGLTLWLLFASFRLVVSQMAARFGLLLLVLFFSCTTHFDFVHFSSELTSLVLLAAGWLYFLRLALQPQFAQKRRNWLVAGILIGCVPFAKLQSLPSAALIGLAMTASLLHSSSPKSWLTTNRLWFLLSGFLFPTILIVTFCWIFGVLDYFYTFYIHSNLFNYGEYYQKIFPSTQLSIWERILHLPAFFQSENAFFSLFVLFIGISFLAFLVLLTRHKRIYHLQYWIGLWSLGWLLAGIYSVAKPGTEFVHHLLYLLLPIGWLTGLASEQIVSTKIANRSFVFPGAILLGNLFILSVLFVNYQQNPAVSNYYLYSFQNRQSFNPNPTSAVSDSMLKYARPNDRLVVWGWNMRYHVETQLPQGTSENHSFRSIVPHSLRDAYQNKYIRDITTTKPALFVDATGPNSLWMTDTAIYKHEKFTALATYIAQQYQLVETVDHVRIYVRKDRVKYPLSARKQALLY